MQFKRNKGGRYVKVVARIEEGDISLSKIKRLLKKPGAYLVRNAVIVKLPEHDKNRYKIPDFIIREDFILMIECSENRTSAGNCTVICDNTGRPLKPYSKPANSKEQALFSAKNEVISLIGNRNSEEIEIKKHKIIRKGRIVSISEELLWKSGIEELPTGLERYKKAADALYRKCRDNNYRRTYFTAY
jgi:hypothetical protein